MPRTPSPPPLPDRPSHWLANFRYRLRGEAGEHLSPESLGYRMGVSGATVRRWESGQASPGYEDLQRFADVCELTSQQREFVHRLFSRLPQTAVGVPTCFVTESAKLLSLNRPACLLDELFYVRAWNSYFAELIELETQALEAGPHALKVAMVAGELANADDDDERLSNLVRAHWLWTAHLGSTEQYTQTVNHLAENKAFRRRWLALLDETEEDCAVPLVMPLRQRLFEGASYVVSMREAVFPPLFRLFVYEPDDDLAEQIMARQIDSGPPRVGFANTLHWSAAA